MQNDRTLHSKNRKRSTCSFGARLQTHLLHLRIVQTHRKKMDGPRSCKRRTEPILNTIKVGLSQVKGAWQSRTALRAICSLAAVRSYETKVYFWHLTWQYLKVVNFIYFRLLHNPITNPGGHMNANQEMNSKTLSSTTTTTTTV